MRPTEERARLRRFISHKQGGKFPDGLCGGIDRDGFRYFRHGR